ncbi:MAG: aldose 1-epimerase family protein [Acidobacteria bacterium]|nr:aldose 1-epimerase family protein [Acidobacteriota bacterium]
MIRLRRGAYKLEVSARGAELQSLVWRGQELLWHGDPAWWGRRAPVLFPIVGKLAGDTLRHEGKTYRMPQHGFARDLTWDVVTTEDDHARFRLQDSEATRACFPFAFLLEQDFQLGEGGLRITLTLSNPGAAPLPASLGLHPGFRVPLPGAGGPHALHFESEETAPMRRLNQGLLSSEGEANPVQGGILRLDGELFARDALIFDALQSRRLTYTAPGAPLVELAWDFPHFGLWSKPGAPFLCLEPWQGFADPEGFKGAFVDKPGVLLLGPGATRSWHLSIRAGDGLS